MPTTTEVAGGRTAGRYGPPGHLRPPQVCVAWNWTQYFFSMFLNSVSVAGEAEPQSATNQEGGVEPGSVTEARDQSEPEPRRSNRVRRVNVRLGAREWA